MHILFKHQSIVKFLVAISAFPRTIHIIKKAILVLANAVWLKMQISMISIYDWYLYIVCFCRVMVWSLKDILPRSKNKWKLLLARCPLLGLLYRPKSHNSDVPFFCFIFLSHTINTCISKSSISCTMLMN